MFKKVNKFELRGRICEVVATERLNIRIMKVLIVIKRLKCYNNSSWEWITYFIL